MPHKRCFKCGETKPLTQFYVHPQMGDGRLNKCKDCTRVDVQLNYRANMEHFKAYDRMRANLPHRVQARKEYAQTEGGKLAALRGRRNYLKRHPEKRAAHIVVGNALRDGKLLRQPCEVCGDVIAEAHHDDYSKPLDVRWLCKRHHMEHHRKAG